MSAHLTIPRQVGVRLVRLNGRPVAWIVPPSRRRLLDAAWDGRIRGKRVPDGNYMVRLIYRSAVLATAPLRIDTHAPQLVDLRADNGSTPFAGDGPLLTTISPNGDGFRDHVDVDFRLKEPATVTMDVTRTVKVPKVDLHADASVRARRAHDDLAPARPNLNPRTYLIRFTAGRPDGQRRHVYGAPNAFVGRHPRGVGRAHPGDRRGIRASRTTRPGELARIHIATDEPSLT